MFTTLRARISALAFIALGVVMSTSAHEGHDHEPAPSPVTARGAPRLEATSELFELVAIARGSELIVYVDRFLTNEPVEGAAVEIETPAGPRQATISGDTYRIAAPWLEKAGRYDLIFTVTLAEEVEILAGALEIVEPVLTPAIAAHSGWMAALAADMRRAVGARLSERVAGVPSLALGAAAGFLAGMATMLLVRRRRSGIAAVALLLALPLATTRAHEGHDHGDGAVATATINQAVPQRLADGALFVPKPTQRILAIRTVFTEIASHATAIELPGRIIPDPNASGYVQASVSGRLSPPPGGFVRLGAPVVAGQVLAYVVPPLTAAESSDQRQRQGELDQQIAIVERRIARFEALARAGAVSRVQLDEARLELAGLRDRRAALDRVRREPEALVAPVPGRIAAANAIAGQIVETNAIVFHVVDPDRLWIEALSFAPLPATLRRASARDAEGRALTLRHAGTGLVDRNQAIVVHLSIVDGPPGLRPGQLLSVMVETEHQRVGVIVPRTSVLRGANGQLLVYEHVAAERFEPREVRVEPLDAERMLVAAGLDRGRRVVTQGAELLNQIR